MKCSKLILTVLACLFLASGAFAQKTKLQRANREYKQLNFQQAITMYLEILDNAESDEAKINLADAYRKIGNTAESEFWYGQIVYLPDAKPVYKLYYGQALQANGKCDLAKEWFEQYSKDVPDDWRGRLLAQTCETNMVRNLNTAKSRFYEIEHLPFNTKMDDFAPTFYENGMLFASERDEGSWKSRTHTWTGKPFLDMYFTHIDTLDAPNFEFTYEKEPSKYEKTLNTKYHDGPFFFSRNFKKVFITRNNIYEGQVNRDDDGIIRLKIFEAELINGKWENMKGFPFNSDEYSVAHPTVTPDGQTMYFASDMPGGFGGMDLYSSQFDNGQWSPPVNLGPRINTEGNEIFPTYHISGKLYFASDGQLGLGGLDIYHTQYSEGQFGPVINMGAPLNSNADDFSVSLNDDETFGYFSSDRAGGVGDDDIYAFKLNIVDVEIFVYDENTGAPIPNANVFDACGEISYKTDANGKVFVQMPTKECCQFSASMASYTDNTKEVCTKDKMSGENLIAKVPLSRPLEFNLAGVVTNKETGNPVAGVVVTLANDCDLEYITATTDEEGKYFFELEPKCCFRVKAEKEGYLADVVKTDLCTRGKVASEAFVQNLALTPYVENPEDPNFIFAGKNKKENGESLVDEVSSVPFVIEHIYYDFNKAYIREDAQAPLAELITVLNENPTIIVEIGSHTDARGSDRYNQQLSEARAKSVVEYLIKSGVDKSRLTYVGYGETDPSNDCVNEVQCSEEDHQRNRRTEFRVIGTVDGKKFVASSKKPQEIRKVDKCTNCPF
jgi:outer membrane protein OmpA-like peptidoglycan-associated protein/tetratricopeptide (TPR) repeat protein